MRPSVVQQTPACKLADSHGHLKVQKSSPMTMPLLSSTRTRWVAGVKHEQTAASPFVASGQHACSSFWRENTFCHASHASHRTGVRVVTDDSTVPEGFSWEIGSVDEAMLEAFRHLVTGRDLQI